MPFFNRKQLLISSFLLLLSATSIAQGSTEYGSGLKINLKEDGSKYMRFIVWNQIWMRSIENNPGTMINGVAANNSWDIGARRIRALVYAQISPRYLILAHWGINNQTIVNGGGSGTSGTGGYGQGKKPQLFFHDVWNEYAVIPTTNPATKKTNKSTLYIGAGLHYWHGLSRMTSASTLNFMMIDAPIFNWPLIENSDQFARQFGLYAKGKIDKFTYRMHLNKPFATNQAPVPGGAAVDNNGTVAPSYGGYFDYQFLEQESNVLPFTVGTYVGSKKVFNIGAGFYTQKNGTLSQPTAGVFKRHNINMFAADVFADLPVGTKKSNKAITAYSVLYNYNFGPNYLRTVGIMNLGVNNPAFTGTRAKEGPGDARYLLGTGNIWYTQVGFLTGKGKAEKPKLRVQPIAAYAYKKFEALAEGGHYYDLGSNFFLDGHHSKITLQYSSRPLYNPTTNKTFKRAGELLLQFQVFL
jgi:hypothetical protein